MTTYNVITDGELVTGQPVTTSLLTRLRDNMLAIIQGDASAPKMSNAALSTVPGLNLWIQNVPGTYALVIPAGIVIVMFDITGPGGYGGPATGSGDPYQTGYGGAGEHRLASVAVTPGETLSVIVGTAGTSSGASSGATGTSTFVKRGSTVLLEAKPGGDAWIVGGTASNGIGGIGGIGGTAFNGEPGTLLSTSSTTGITTVVQGGTPHGGNSASNGAAGNPGLVIARY